MPKYHIWTIGCQMNRAESERLEARFASHGYSPSACAEEADVIVVNSCVVRQHAEDKVVNKLYNLKTLKRDRPGLRIALTGCFVGQEADELVKRFPYVDYFFKPGEIPDWLQKEHCSPALPQNTSVTAFVPVIQGCNNFCTYCIVPYRRGREVSRSLAEIVCEVSELVQCGVKEVTLVGQNVDSYGHDLPGKPDLAALLEELDRIDGLLRIRFLTNHPKDMSPRLIAAMGQMDKVCRQINLPAQSGDNAILEAMHRGYTAGEYRDLIGRLRNAMPDIAITTDVIVGFPGESAEQFQNTYNLLAELKFDAVHSAAYSPRPGTLAACKYADDVPAEIKKARLDAVEQLQENVSTGINARMLGRTIEVLVEAENKSRWQGRTRSDKIVFFSGGDDLIGKPVMVVIEKTSPWSLQGRATDK
jgi:tRNA-2-methylthio-N6-dimethylallyladenosine synthase